MRDVTWNSSPGSVCTRFILFEDVKARLFHSNKRLFGRIRVLVLWYLGREGAVIVFVKQIIQDVTVVDVVALDIVEMVVRHGGLAILVAIKVGAVAKGSKIAAPLIVHGTWGDPGTHFRVQIRIFPMKSDCNTNDWDALLRFGQWQSIVNLVHGAAVDVTGLLRGLVWQRIYITINRDDYGCARRSGIDVRAGICL